MKAHGEELSSVYGSSGSILVASILSFLLVCVAAGGMLLATQFGWPWEWLVAIVAFILGYVLEDHRTLCKPFGSGSGPADSAEVAAEQKAFERSLSYEQQLRVWETGYGRDSGWILELRGDPIALFTDCQNEDMFWDSYRITPLTEDRQLWDRLQTLEFWRQTELAWRNRESGIVVTHAYPGIDSIPDPHRKWMRGLYIPIGPPSPADEKNLRKRKILQREDQPSSGEPPGDARM